VLLPSQVITESQDYDITIITPTDESIVESTIESVVESFIECLLSLMYILLEEISSIQVNQTHTH